MPSRPNTPCRHPGCPELVPSGTKYCDKHKPLHPEEVRSAGSRGYNRAWQKARKEYLEAHPLCVRCMDANVKHFFTSLGNEFFTSYGKQFFTLYGKKIFTLFGKQIFTFPGKEFFTSPVR